MVEKKTFTELKSEEELAAEKAAAAEKKKAEEDAENPAPGGNADADAEVTSQPQEPTER